MRKQKASQVGAFFLTTPESRGVAPHFPKGKLGVDTCKRVVIVPILLTGSCEYTQESGYSTHSRMGS